MDKQTNLSLKHTGFRISAKGVLGRIRDNHQITSSLRYACGEMLNHLEELGKRFYAGDIKAIDEFLQLYSLDNDRKY